MISIAITVIILIYILLILIFWIGWEKAQPCPIIESELPGVTVVIAVRNEEKNIGHLLTDLARQDYPSSLLEIVIINDHSEDNTTEIIRDVILNAAVKIRFENLRNGSGKKMAIARAIELASNNIILATDGDCLLSPNWVDSMVRCLDNPEIQFVSGPVNLHPQESIFQRLQAIEFSSLIASGAATLSLGWPTMANAANMAFRKEAYDEAAIKAKEVASGDDVFLLHSIGQRYKNGYVFCRDESAVVRTNSSSALSLFFQQRKRWSGKWQHYSDLPTKTLAGFIFLVNLGILIVPFLAFNDYISWELALNLMVVKLLFEFWFLREVQIFFKNRFLLHEFIILAIIYPVYVTIMAIAGLIGNYQWKGRSTR